MEGNDMIYPFKKDPFPGKYAYYFTHRFNDQYEVSFSRDWLQHIDHFHTHHLLHKMLHSL
jgi:hypothetical protein